MTNRQVARILDEIADMLQFQDENPFKIKAYRQAAKTIYHLDEDIQYLYDKGCLAEIPGVGSGIKSKIEEMIETGSCAYYEELCEQVPEGLVQILALPGVGPKTIQAAYEYLGIANREELYEAACNERLRMIPGLGAKTEERIIKGFEMLNNQKQTLGSVYPPAAEMLTYLRECEQVAEADLAGSIRRGKSLVGDVDIVVGTQDESAVNTYILKYNGIKRISTSGPGHIAGFLHYDIPFEIIIVPPAEYCATLFWATGSKNHLARLIPGLDRNMTKGCTTETEIYQRFNLSYIPPEIREDQGEIELAAEGSLPRLVELNDLQGDLHTHSRWSDGSSTLTELAEAARRLDYTYLAITDHSRSLAISGGLNEERLHAQGQEIERLNRQWDDFTLFKGTEVDILKDGSLDFSDDVLEELDIVIGSIHSHFHLSEEKQTERIVRAMKDENVDIIGHLSGRLLNRRPPYELDLDRILDEAAGNRTILEINSHPDRLDIDAELARQAHQKGIKIAINSDAHHKNDLQLTNYGVLNARRGWLSRDAVINTWNQAEVIRYLKE